MISDKASSIAGLLSYSEGARKKITNPNILRRRKTYRNSLSSTMAINFQSSHSCKNGKHSVGGYLGCGKREKVGDIIICIIIAMRKGMRHGLAYSTLVSPAIVKENGLRHSWELGKV